MNKQLLLSVIYILSETLLGKTNFSLQEVTNGDSFLVRDKSSCPVSTLSTGTPSDLKLWKSCECFHSLCEFLCTLASLCVEDTVLLVSTIYSGSDNLPASSSTWTADPGEDGLVEDITISSNCSYGQQWMDNRDKLD